MMRQNSETLGLQKWNKKVWIDNREKLQKGSGEIVVSEKQSESKLRKSHRKERAKCNEKVDIKRKERQQSEKSEERKYGEKVKEKIE